PWLRDRLQKEPARNPGRHAHLPCLQNNVAPPRLLLERLLRLIRSQRLNDSHSVSDTEELWREGQQVLLTLVQLFPDCNQFLQRTTLPIRCHPRLTASCIPWSAAPSPRWSCIRPPLSARPWTGCAPPESSLRSPHCDSCTFPTRASPSSATSPPCCHTPRSPATCCTPREP